jgi:hypothetical protein
MCGVVSFVLPQRVHGHVDAVAPRRQSRVAIRSTFGASGFTRDGEPVNREAARSKYVEGRVAPRHAPRTAWSPTSGSSRNRDSPSGHPMRVAILKSGRGCLLLLEMHASTAVPSMLDLIGRI